MANFWDAYTTLEQKVMWESFRSMRTAVTVLRQSEMTGNPGGGYISMSCESLLRSMYQIANALDVPEFVRRDAGIPRRNPSL